MLFCLISTSETNSCVKYSIIELILVNWKYYNQLAIKTRALIIPWCYKIGKEIYDYGKS